MSSDAEKKPAEVVIEEEWLVEWYWFGLGELEAYLDKHAAFDQYLLDHPRPAEP